MDPSWVLLNAMLLAAAPANFPCNPLPGVQALSTNDKLRWIVVGEMHGTNETPAAFIDLVCAASSRRSVVVAVEQPITAQAAIEAFISSNGSAEARAAFLRSPIWASKMKDGRSSEAYFRLFDAVRILKKAGRVKRVLAFQPATYPGPDGYEKLMAKELSSRASENELVLALVGNLHARLTPSASYQTYTPMAGYLPPDKVASIDVRSDGGSMWACMDNGCRVQNLGPTSGDRTRALVLDNGIADGYSGVLYLGVPATASLPQKAE